MADRAAETPVRAGRRAKREQGRWVREVKGILALALSGFGFVALYAFDPTLHLLDQSSPVGPVGVWLGWVFKDKHGHHIKHDWWGILGLIGWAYFVVCLCAIPLRFCRTLRLLSGE